MTNLEQSPIGVRSIDIPSRLTAMLLEKSRENNFTFKPSAHRARIDFLTGEFEPHLNCIGFARYILGMLSYVNELHPDIHIASIERYTEADQQEPYHASVAVINPYRKMCSAIDLQSSGPRTSHIEVGHSRGPMEQVRNFLDSYTRQKLSNNSPIAWQLGANTPLATGSRLPKEILNGKAKEYILATSGEDVFDWEPIWKWV